MNKAAPENKPLVKEAKRVGHHKTEQPALKAELREYIEWRKRTQIIKLFGKIDYDPSYDYKAERRKKRA
ncbi:MAG: type II toxin-antitoxin system VapB family antitoxin [Candidatus Sumerlaeota bacterium]|nr:type II toxin-antitoxin system VapB family antitoxin [Candidatus Sumerlaeota bacterium]